MVAPDIEAKLAEARSEAARLRRAVTVCEGGAEMAIVWPDGRIDIQSPGAALISSTAKAVAP
jgi:Tfp pilus assembly protein FimT